MAEKRNDIIRNGLLDKSDPMIQYMLILMNTDFAYGRGRSRWTDLVYVR